MHIYSLLAWQSIIFLKLESMDVTHVKLALTFYTIRHTRWSKVLIICALCSSKIEELAWSSIEFSTSYIKSTRSTSFRKPDEADVVIISTRVEESLIPKRTHKLGISPIDKTGVGFVRGQSSQSDNVTLENTVVPQVKIKSFRLS